MPNHVYIAMISPLFVSRRNPVRFGKKSTFDEKTKENVKYSKEKYVTFFVAYRSKIVHLIDLWYWTDKTAALKDDCNLKR